MKKILDLGMELKVARTRTRLTLRELEEFFNGHPTFVDLCNIENGKVRPTPRTLRLVEGFIKMKPEAVLLKAKAMGIEFKRKGRRREHGET